MQVWVKRHRWGVLLAGALAVLAGVLVWAFVFDTYRLETVTPGVLYRDGNRGLREFTNGIREVHPRTVVMLVSDKEFQDAAKPQFRQEAEFLRNKGIALERIPISRDAWPTTSDVHRFLALVADPHNQPVLVHCARGVRRTGMMVAAYQMSLLHYSASDAKAVALFGGTGDESTSDLLAFIVAYDAAGESVAHVDCGDLKSLSQHAQ